MASAKKTAAVSAEIISKAYRRAYLLEGKPPVSVFAFCDQNAWTEAEFYSFYTDFKQLDSAYWTENFDAAVNRLKASEEWGQYGAREKWLAFYFTWFEMLLEERSFAIATAPSGPTSTMQGSRYSDWKERFVKFARELIAEGEANGEIERRSFIGERYPEALWMQNLFLLGFWISDRSKGFEDTDAAIEKSVNLAFELFRKGVLESAIDAFRFFSRKNPMESWPMESWMNRMKNSMKAV
jgi:hypothetical protein